MRTMRTLTARVIHTEDQYPGGRGRQRVYKVDAYTGEVVGEMWLDPPEPGYEYCDSFNFMTFSVVAPGPFTSPGVY